MPLVDKINEFVVKAFQSEEDLLAFYRKELPLRVGSYHQEEVGPIMHHDLPGEADNFVKKIFHLGQETLDMSSGLDWYGSPSGDLEWNGGLVRQGYFMLLAEEYRKTKDEKYARTIIEHILNYIENVPPFDPEGRPYLEFKKSTWRPFEAAGRAAENWPEALAKIIGSPHMTPATWAKIFHSIHEHAVFLRKHHWKTGNHATLEVAALGILSIFYQEMKEADDYRKYAVDFLEGMWPKLFNEDGYTKEMSGGYHWVAMRSYFAFYEVALNNGFENIFPSRYKERLILTSLAELYQDKPDFSIPITNDSNTKTNRREQLERIAQAFKLNEVKYVLTDGREGTAPLQVSYFYPITRVGIMRSDWSRDARYLFVDLGEWGDNHMNEDQLNVEVSAYGKKFLVNSGRWRYTTSPDADWMEWAKYFKVTNAYNSLTVDGYNQVPGDAEGSMVISTAYDYAEGKFSAGYGEEVEGVDEKILRDKGITSQKVCRVTGVTHTRRVFFVKPDFWVLRDEVAASGEHFAEQIWHYYEGDLVEKGGFWVTGFHDANLLIKTVGTNSIEPLYYKGSESPIAGWHCPYYDIKRPVPELRFKQAGKDKFVFHTLIFPVKGKVSDLPEFTVKDAAYQVKYRSQNWSIKAPDTGSFSL